MSGKEAVRKVRLENRKSIRESAARIAKEERILKALKVKLEEARTIPNAEAGKLQEFEEGVQAYEAMLSILKTDHSEFVREQAQPSPSFPSGIQAATL